ncbi:MAG: hypothetical protein P1U35_02880 [Cycloclasticus sp.]|nr:hypothetical protein [Cycloclasticus sp.]
MQDSKQSTVSPMSKNERVFKALMSGRSFNRFEAEHQLADHCLPSTIATLERKHHITISRKYETVRGYMGSPTKCCRYWIEPEEIKRIEEIKCELNG